MYDVIIIGGGPAGVASAIYSTRKNMNTLIVAKSFGGQSIVSGDIQNWIGEIHISGLDLAEKLENHLKSYEGIDIKEDSDVVNINKVNRKDIKYPIFEIETKTGDKYKGKTVIVATGGRRRKLGLPNEKKFDGKGIVYCSTCDAPMFKDKDVAVVGGGNAGIEAIIDLLPYANKIYLLEQENTLKADQTNQTRIESENKVEIILNVNILEIQGDKMVSGLTYEINEQKKLKVEGIFVEIGSTPNSDVVKDLLELDDCGQIKIDPRHATTSEQGIFAAGDVTDDFYKQNNIAVSGGVKAALSAYNYLQKGR